MSTKYLRLRLIISILFLFPSYVLATISPSTHDLILGDYNGDNIQDIFYKEFYLKYI